MGQTGLVLTLKDAQRESCELSFIWGKRGLQPWRQYLESFEKLLQRNSREGQYICDFGKGNTCSQAHLFSRKFLLVS